MPINHENQPVDFFIVTNDTEKDIFVRHLLHKQLELWKFMANLYRDSNILHDHAILIDAVEKPNITKILVIDWMEQWQLMIFQKRSSQWSMNILNN